MCREMTGIKTSYAQASVCSWSRENLYCREMVREDEDFPEVAFMVTPPYRDRGCHPALALNRDRAPILARTSVEAAFWQ
jgi:hypothetical protein